MPELIETDRLVCGIHQAANFELNSDREVEIAELLEAAREAAGRAYAPYSNFAVGCAVMACNLHDERRMTTGCNIENASYGATMCAERTAIFASVSQGYRDFKYLALSTSNSVSESDLSLRSPCGLCRQVMSEFFSPETILVIDGGTNKQKKNCIDIATIDTLLPWRFRLISE